MTTSIESTFIINNMYTFIKLWQGKLITYSIEELIWINTFRAVFFVPDNDMDSVVKDQLDSELLSELRKI